MRNKFAILNSMDIEYLCNHIIKIIRCPVRIYNSDNKLQKIFGIYDKKDSLQIELQTYLIENPNYDYPVLNIDKDNIIYARVICKNKKIIVGPCNIGENNNKASAAQQVSLDIFLEEILLMHNLYNKNQISLAETLIKNFITEELLFKINKDITGNFINDVDLHNPYDRELRIMRSIKSGDLNSLKQGLEEKFIGNYGTMAKDKLRSAKNVAICHICLSSRAAIEGGIPFETAFSVCDKFVIKLEEITKLEQIEALEKEAQFYFLKLVNIKRNNQDISKNILIDQCKNIIIKNINKKIVIKDIAKELYTNSDYLSRVFSKTEGITIKDYILREKVELSKNMLIYHKYSFGQIALFLHFYSQSHYIKVFKKFTGMTPKQFKDIYCKK